MLPSTCEQFQKDVRLTKDIKMDNPIVLQAAQDPTLIAGIYDTCDQWCLYCPATDRCLAYRCRAQTTPSGGSIYRALADRLFEGMFFLEQLLASEGRPNAELNALLSDDPREQVPLVEIDDPLERMGRRYLTLSESYLRSRSDFPPDLQKRPGGPTPFEVFAWYHALVPAKIYRALVAAAQAARGETDRRWEALVSAKVALIGIDRSLKALADMAREADDPRLQLLQAHLRRLQREMDGRFPEARKVLRPGLDVAVMETVSTGTESGR